MVDQLDFQIGKVIKVNTDRTIDIQDFRTGGVVYKGIDIEQPAGDQFQPVVGQHVLFFTVKGRPQFKPKVVRLYGSADADQDLVLSSPIDLDPGERKLVSQTGAVVYVANGGLHIASGGQSYTLLDAEQLTQIIASKLQLLTRGGFLINEEDGTLTIKKGTLRKTNTKYEADDPTITITLVDDQIKLNGDTPVARQDDPVKSTSAEDTKFWTWLQGFINVFQTWVPVPPDGGTALKTALTAYLSTNPVPQELSSKITGGSDTVKSG